MKFAMTKLETQFETADRLRVARRAAGFNSAKKFARTHNIPYTTYIQHETGKRSIKNHYAIQYAEILQINLHWLLTGKGEAFNKTDQNHEKKIILNQALEKLAGRATQLPAVLDQLAMIHMNLFTDILHTMNKYLPQDTCLSYEKLIDLCMEIYTKIINLVDATERQIIIQNTVKTLTDNK